MKTRTSLSRVLPIGLLIAVCSLCSPARVYAYLDPGTGSYIFQLLVAGILGGLFAIKIYWNKLKAFMNNLFNKEHNDESE